MFFHEDNYLVGRKDHRILLEELSKQKLSGELNLARRLKKLSACVTNELRHIESKMFM